MRSIIGLLIALTSTTVVVADASLDEQATAARFMIGQEQSSLHLDGITIISNHDAVQKNARFGKPLRIGGVEYARGLFCHAKSELLVNLKSGKATRFHAVVGVDQNGDTDKGQGSVIFTVLAGEQVLFQSPVMHGNDAGLVVDVELPDVPSITLKIDDAGDGISSDQGDWADAYFVLENGERMWLDELAMPSTPVQTDWQTPPYSFIYSGVASSEQLPKWRIEEPPARPSTLEVKPSVQIERSMTDPATGLQVRYVATHYPEEAVVEWTLYFKNTGTVETPIIENIRPLDIALACGDRGEFTLHHARGSANRQDDFEPLTTKLAKASTFRLAPEGGRSANGVMPYFNLESSIHQGILVAVGWPGQWSAEFARDDAKGLRLTAGQELTHFKLLPGEEVRTPLIAMMFWNGDVSRAHNRWRQWMFKHGMTRPNGQPPQPQFLAASSRAYEEMIKADSASQMMFMDRFREEGIKLDYWWMDAGWYIQEKGWPQVGTWEVDTKRFPGGLRPISDYGRKHGVKTLVWFEPERVAADTWLTKNHPEWILGGEKGGLLDFGNPEALQWVTEHVNGLIDSEGIDLYRQDFNMDPLKLWREKDAPDRQGISEIKHVTGLLAYWDEIIRRHPGMLIDTCASGGRRIDLETARRAVPLWRSDYAYEPVGHQGMTYGLSLWLPYHGTGTVACADAPYYGGGVTPVEPYAFWSNAAPSLGCGIDMRVREIDYPAFRSLVEQWRAVNKYYYGDFYALTPYSVDHSDWMAWQFHMPESGEGMVQVFRRKNSVYSAAEFPLYGIKSDVRYAFTDVATGRVIQADGASLMSAGLPIAIDDKPGVVVLSYQEIR